MRPVAHLVLAGALFAVLPASAHAQSEPYKVFDTRPVLTQGPYLVASIDTSTTIVWMTDTPSHSKVRYARGAGLDAARLTLSAEPQQDGLVPATRFTGSTARNSSSATGSNPPLPASPIRSR